MRAYLLGITLALAACSTVPQAWTRPDGKIDPAQFELDKTVCRGEMQKAAVSQREPKIYLPGEENPLTTIFVGCMAQHGYMVAAH